MTPSAQRLLDKALRLPIEERGELVDALYDSTIEYDGLDPHAHLTDAELQAEIARRVADAESGAAEFIPWEQVRERLLTHSRTTAPSRGHPLFDLLRDLDAAKIHFTIGRHQPDTVLVTLTLVGQRVEIDVFADGRLKVSRFVGGEEVIGDEEMVKQIITDNCD